MFSIDGAECDVICSIDRIMEITPSENSGMMLNKSYFNDVLGSFLKYTITIKVPLDKMATYSWIYEKLTEPVEGHVFELPYNQGTIEITGRVENVSDSLGRLPGGRLYWKDTTFTVIANHPSKSMTAGEAVTRGRAPLPEVENPEEGDTYTYHNGEWVIAQSYPDADTMSF